MVEKHIPARFLDRELAQEKASALGRLGRAFETALAALCEFDRAHAHASLSTQQRRLRDALVEQASAALWHFVVQREACGLRDARHVLRDYRVSAEIAARMGAMQPAMPRRR